MATLLITRKTSSRSILVIKNTTRSIRVSGVIQTLLHLLRHRCNSSLQPCVVLTEALALLCQEHEKPLILIDSYAKVTAPLGIDEFKPEAANPIYDLMSAVAPYEARVVLIHHIPHSGGIQSPALTHLVSQLIT